MSSSPSGPAVSARPTARPVTAPSSPATPPSSPAVGWGGPARPGGSGIALPVAGRAEASAAGHGELEARLQVHSREQYRLLLQGHLDERARLELRRSGVTGSDGVSRPRVENGIGARLPAGVRAGDQTSAVAVPGPRPPTPSAVPPAGSASEALPGSRNEADDAQPNADRRHDDRRHDDRNGAGRTGVGTAGAESVSKPRRAGHRGHERDVIDADALPPRSWPAPGTSPATPAEGPGSATSKRCAS